MIYLDYNATTPIDKEVADAMQPFLTNYFGNPSSSHVYGLKTKKAVEKAREQIAKMIHAHPSEIIFTSGGTESNNYALKGVAFAQQHKGNHIITSNIEHPAVIEVCKYLETKGFSVTYLSVDEFGIINLEELNKSVTNETILISIMHANNEVGSIQPIKEISEIAQKNKILFHTDAAQSIGKIEANVQEMGVDLMSIAGHKLYAPKGVGVLYIRNGVILEKLMHGANHENNLRAGTENVLEIVGMGKAAELISENLQKYQVRYAENRDLLWAMLKNHWPKIKRNGHPDKCLSNTLSVSFPNVEANTLLGQLADVAASAGAACHTNNISVSNVLQAMEIPINYAMGTIRFSTGRTTTKDDIEQAVEAIAVIL